MIFANLCQLRDQTRRQIMATLLLIVFSFSILSACSDNAQAELPVGEVYNQHERGLVLRPQHQQSHPNQRVALVIGNGAYQKEPLPNPPNDSDDMATVLKLVGFDVMLLKDASLKKMKTAIQAFGEKLKKGGVGLFYFAGHGVQYQGENFLFPIESMPSVTVAEHLPYETVNVGYILATMEGAKNNLNIVILDACRNNPFARSLLRGRGVNNPEGLASMEVPTGTLIAYATRPNKTALDGTGGRNSPYVKSLKQELPKPGLSILEVLTNVRVAVKKETKNSQAPGFYSELDRKFCFVGPCGQVSPPTPVLKPESDRDKDGVADSQDKCPDNRLAELSQGVYKEGSSMGYPIESVDERGCPIDRDQDSVADYQDSCLGTNAGVKVKENGCPVSSAMDQFFRDPLDGSKGPEMVWIPAGSFRMGDIQGGGYSSEKPVHRVSINRFAMSRTEVTVGEFRRFVNATGYKTEAEKGDGCYTYKDDLWSKVRNANWRNPNFSQNDNHPVVCVSLNDATAYVEWLNRETGKQYRLPTEAEWEYAARAGTETARYWGNEPDEACRYANAHDKTSKKENGFSWTHHNCVDGYAKTAPVGSFKPNDFGLFDMLGNVWEWTCSKYEDKYGGEEKRCTSKKSSSPRVLRGGAWHNRPGDVRVTNRGRHLDDFRLVYAGFRLSRH